MLLLALPPFVLATLLWEGLLWWGLQAFIDTIQHYFVEHDGYATSGKWLTWFGLGAIKTAIVPLLAMWILLPLMMATALIFVGAMAAPGIVRHVAGRGFPALERRRGASLPEMAWTAASSVCIFIALWLITTPLCMFPFVGFVIQPLLWGWLTYRVITYAVLADHADGRERAELMHAHRRSLLLIGTLTGAVGVAPALLWLGGAMSIVMFPVFAALSILIYVLAFTFSGLWLAHYGLAAMGKRRAVDNAANALAGGANNRIPGANK